MKPWLNEDPSKEMAGMGEKQDATKEYGDY
jgi:hypothetical protein